MGNSISFWLLLAPVILFSTCGPKQQETTNKARSIVDSCIAVHGGDRYEHSCIRFDFRGKHYIRFRNKDNFVLSRHFTDSSGDQIRDVINNGDYYRKVSGEKIAKPEKGPAYKSSLNSVIYFAMLPYRLKDKAAQLKMAGKTTLKGEPYYRIRVTFRQENGGKDHEDIYMYWIHRDAYTMDYFAYRYFVNSGGVRFREVSDIKNVQGIRFQNYINYKPPEIPEKLIALEKLYVNNNLEEVSRIIKENIEVVPQAEKETCMSYK